MLRSFSHLSIPSSSFASTRSFSSAGAAAAAATSSSTIASQTIAKQAPKMAKKLDLANPVKMTFVLRNGTQKAVTAYVGENLLDVSIRENINEVEGACEGACACSTCHMIFDPKVYTSLPRILDDENDMLDMAACLTDTSRLGCQIKVSKTLDGAVVALPKEVVNNYQKD
jgi:ferredoxin